MTADDVTRSHLARRRHAPWTSDRVAEELVPLRDRLVDRLPREIAASRDLSRDQQELVIDDAIGYMVTEYAKPLHTNEELDRAFWASASFRVKRMHEGRGATVRGGFRRADLENLDQLAGAEDPEAAVLRRDEELTLLEFVAPLTPQERRVFACKYGSGARVAGRTVVSRWLGLPVGEVRKMEREIARKLDRFVTMLAAGALCSYRSEAILALATAGAGDEQVIAARLHLKRCLACRTVYAEHARALRSGELQRRIASLLPFPVAERAGDDRPWRGALLDWAASPFAGDRGVVATQALSSGVGRGAGTAATLKLLSICIGGATLTGGAAICLQAVVAPDGASQRPHVARATPTPAASPPRPHFDQKRRPKVVSTPTPTPDRRPVVRQKPKPKPSGSTDEHEGLPISPAPADAQAGGTEEFGPTSATSTSQPATAPSTGAPEFP
jgi:hypothetical protein